MTLSTYLQTLLIIGFWWATVGARFWRTVGGHTMWCKVRVGHGGAFYKWIELLATTPNFCRVGHDNLFGLCVGTFGSTCWRIDKLMQRDLWCFEELCTKALIDQCTTLWDHPDCWAEWVVQNQTWQAWGIWITLGEPPCVRHRPLCIVVRVRAHGSYKLE